MRHSASMVKWGQVNFTAVIRWWAVTCSLSHFQNNVPRLEIGCLHSSPGIWNLSRSCRNSNKIVQNNISVSLLHTSCTREHVLTHWGRDKMTTILQTTFWNAFYWRSRFVFWFKFHRILLPWPAVVQSRRDDHVTSYYLNQWWHSLLKHMWFTRPR